LDVASAWQQMAEGRSSLVAASTIYALREPILRNSIAAAAQSVAEIR